MKPNDFSMNTDYLSITQTGKYTFTVVVPGGTVPAGGQTVQHYDFAIPAQKGAIDQMMIKRDNGNYNLGHMLSIYENGNPIGSIWAERTVSSNMQAEVSIDNLFSSTALTYPTMTFTIKVSSFKPPNVV